MRVGLFFYPLRIVLSLSPTRMREGDPPLRSPRCADLFEMPTLRTPFLPLFSAVPLHPCEKTRVSDFSFSVDYHFPPSKDRLAVDARDYIFKAQHRRPSPAAGTFSRKNSLAKILFSYTERIFCVRPFHRFFPPFSLISLPRHRLFRIFRS